MDDMLDTSNYDYLEIVHKNGLFNHTYPYSNSTTFSCSQNGTTIVKCLERLSGLNKVETSSINGLDILKNGVKTLCSRHDGRNNHVFRHERRTTRLDRVGSTDSVAVSSGGSDHGGSDSCQSTSSNVSEPCSPETESPDSPCPGTPQPMPPIPPSLADNCRADSDDSITLSETLVALTKNEYPTSGQYSLSQGHDNATDTVCDNKKNFFYDCIYNDKSLCDDNARLGSKSECEVNEEYYTAIGDSSECEVKPNCHVGDGLEKENTSSSSSSSSSNQSSTASPEIQTNADDSHTVTCKWINCEQKIVCSGQLVEHIRKYHVERQSDSETFTCLWVGCKVYNRPSCSLSWLERHILCHGGNKPFKCIVERCDQRFTSQSALERHVNSHFNSASAPNGSKVGRSKDDTPTKLIKKKKLRYRRKCMAVKTEDFFDARIMEHVRHGLLELNSITGLDTEGIPGTITFYSTVIARRMEGGGKVKVLLHWSPENMLPDNWVPESQASSLSHRIIPISSLPRDVLAQLDPTYACRPSCSPMKRKRK